VSYIKERLQETFGAEFAPVLFDIVSGKKEKRRRRRFAVAQGILRTGKREHILCFGQSAIHRFLLKKVVDALAYPSSLRCDRAPAALRKGCAERQRQGYEHRFQT